MRRLVPVALALACAGCWPLRWTTFHPSASLPGAVDFQVCRQVAGFMDTATGWCLDLAVPSEQVRTGEEVRVPGGGTRAKFGGLPWSRPAGVPAGTIRFVEVRGGPDPGGDGPLRRGPLGAAPPPLVPPRPPGRRSRAHPLERGGVTTRIATRRIFRAIPLLALALAAGCVPYRRTIFHRSADAPTPGSYVLDICRQWSGPFPHMAKGWCFDLTLRPERVREAR